MIRYDRAQLCSGYGTKMEITRISVDAPPHFLDPHRVARRFPRPKPEVYSGVDEAAYVLPAGQSILAATIKGREMNQKNRRKDSKGYSIFPEGKQVSFIP